MPPVKKELKTLKAEIRSLIVSSPVGLTVEKFLREFKECIGLTLPFKDFGYSNAQDFLNSMPDVLQLKKTATGVLLVPVENELTSHINKLVSNQRTARKKDASKPRMSTFNNCRYYQVVTHKKKKQSSVSHLSLESSDSSFELDEIYNLQIDWTTKYPRKHFSNIMSYGETNYFSSLKRPEPVSINDLPETVKGSTSTKYHESNCEDRGNPRTLELNTINVKENYRPESAASEDLENGSEHSQTYSLEKLSLNNDGGSADNAPVFDGPQSRYSQIRCTSSQEKEDIKRSFKLPDSRTITVNATTLTKCYQKISATNASRMGNDVDVSAEHEQYLSALIRGIVLDPSKVNDPYKHFLSLAENSKDSDAGNDNTPSKSAEKYELNFESNMDGECTTDNDIIKINNKIFSYFREICNEKLHCKNESRKNVLILKSDSSDDLTEDKVTSSFIPESVNNKFEDDKTEENIKCENKSGIGRGLFLEQFLKSKEDSAYKTAPPICNSLSFGRGIALKNLLQLHNKRKSKIESNVGFNTNRKAGFGRGLFLKVMEERHFQSN
ncbi:uncharacterized protein isoform X1 [Rhodnius prolixus]|uniref:HTH OST-type domain-containing protein n=1 Tax=Rhodnius prolixus TaxID=13249 RepID=T1I8L3_RHOPR